MSIVTRTHKNKLEHYGQKTKGNDGITYKSKFEAIFANKFLHKQFSYTYEPLYQDGTKSRADFYLDELNCWLELVYNPVEYVHAFESKVTVNLVVSYDNRNEVKRYGALWNPDAKTWYINVKDINEYNKNKLIKWMSAEDSHVVGTKEKNTIQEDYEQRLQDKIERNKDKAILVINYEDVKKHSDLADLVRVKDNQLFHKLKDNAKLAVEQKVKKTLNKDRSPLELAVLMYKGLSEADKRRFMNIVRDGLYPWEG